MDAADDNKGGDHLQHAGHHRTEANHHRVCLTARRTPSPLRLGWAHSLPGTMATRVGSGSVQTGAGRERTEVEVEVEVEAGAGGGGDGGGPQCGSRGSVPGPVT